MRSLLRPAKKRVGLVPPAIFICLLICLIIAIISHHHGDGTPPPENAVPYYINILNDTGKAERVDLEAFVSGVVAAEMPVTFAPEALQAQAVAARTYIVSHWPPYGTPRHENAAVCCDSTCCQAYLSDAALRERWGENYQSCRAKIAAAVADTAGEVLFYNGEIAQTPFFSTCGGSTESSAACWSGHIPYLSAVSCPYCRSSPRFAAWKRFSLAEAAARLGVAPADLAAMRILSHTPGYRVGQLSVGSKTYRGTEVRSLLELDSAAFTWLIMGDDIIFASLGFGHGVGMCQYGADGMAKSGCTCRQILAHYYPGTEIMSLYSLPR